MPKAKTEIIEIGGKQYLGEEAATKYLRFRNRLTLYRRRKAGQLAYYKLGAAIIYSLEDLNSFVEQQRRVDQPRRAA